MYQDEVQTWKETICDSQSDILYGKCELYEGTIQTIATIFSGIDYIKNGKKLFQENT